MQESNKSTGIIVAMVAVVMVVGGAIWFMNRGTNGNGQNDQAAVTEQDRAPQQDIVELASANENLSTLVTAVQAADLVETLQGEGPFTVFAPTNEAFEALPEGTLESLLEPANKDQLAAVLTYHVVPTKALSSDLTDGQTITTVQGDQLTVRISGDSVQIVDASGNAANVVTANVTASNGVVHVIDRVLLP
jgi:uncharacterized surface protein with fasciclin (FAS1) repeats